MIRLDDLREAIAECEGEREPKADTCIKLAAYYTIMDHMGGNEPPAYSHQAEPVARQTDSIRYEGDSDFARAVDGKSPDAIWPIMDELMSTLQALNPRLYAGVMRRIDS